MVEFTKRIFKLGNSYAVLVPKQLVECKVFSEKQQVTVTLEKKENKEAFFRDSTRDLQSTYKQTGEFA